MVLLVCFRNRKSMIFLDTDMLASLLVLMLYSKDMLESQLYISLLDTYDLMFKLIGVFKVRLIRVKTLNNEFVGCRTALKQLWPVHP